MCVWGGGRVGTDICIGFIPFQDKCEGEKNPGPRKIQSISLVQPTPRPIGCMSLPVFPWPGEKAEQRTLVGTSVGWMLLSLDLHCSLWSNRNHDLGH